MLISCADEGSAIGTRSALARSCHWTILGGIVCLDDDELKSALLDIERRGWDSLCESTGGSFYGGLMTADAVMVLANGAVMDRESVIESLEQAPPWRTYDINDVRVIRTGSDSATLVYAGTAHREEEEPAFVGVMSRVYRSPVYRRHDDAWRLALSQQTPIANAD